MPAAGTFTTDRNLVIRSWDPWIAEITGIEANSAIGQQLLDLFPDITERGLEPRLRHVLANDAVEVLAPAFHHYFLACPPRVATPNFVRMQQHVTLSPIREAAGVTGLVVTIEDVTERLDRERAIARELHHGDEAVRIQAAKLLAREQAAPSTLMQAFGDQSWRVRSAAVSGFASRSSEEITAALTAALRDQHRDLSVVNATLSALAISGKDVLPELFAYLRSSDTDLRIYVALALGHMNDARAEPALIEALDDEDANVRFHAIEALGRLQARSAAQRLADIAGGGDFFLSFAALEALGEIKDTSVAPRLLELLEDPSLAEPAMETLAKIAGEELVSTIGRQLSAGKVSVVACARAINAVYERADDYYGDGEVVSDLAAAAIDDRGRELVLAAFEDAAAGDRAALARVLGWLQGERVIAVLVAALNDPGVRHVAMDALIARGSESVPALLQAMKSESSEIVKAAIVTLGRIGDRAAVAGLIDALSESPDIAIVAAHALGTMGDARAFEPLIGLLDDAQDSVRHAAVAAINSIGSAELRGRTQSLLESDSVRVRESAARIAGYFGYPECAPAMLGFVTHPDRALRRTAIEHLPFFNDAQVPSVIRAALGDESADVRAAAARGIGRLEGAEGLQLLTEALHHRDPWVRYNAAQSVDARTGVQVLLPLCRQAQSDPHPPARMAATRALGRIADPSTTRVLSEQIEDADDEIAVAALDAISRTSDAAARGSIVAALRSGVAARMAAALRALERSGIAANVTSELKYTALRSEDTEIATTAIGLLASIGGTTDEIAELAREPRLRAAAVAALTKMFNADITRSTVSLESEDPFLRAVVVEALGRCRDRRAAGHVGKRVHDSDPGVRSAAETALQRLDLRATAQRPNGNRVVRAADGATA